MSDVLATIAPDAKFSGQLEEHLAREVAVLRDMAVKSSDPLVVAKAVAISHDGVQWLIRDRLEAGARIAEVFALHGGSQHEVRVFFRFRPLERNGSDVGILALVDLGNADVIAIVYPFVLQSQQDVGRPFVTVAAPDAATFLADDQAMKRLVDREREFLASLGLGHLLGRDGDYGSYDFHAVSVTYSPVGPGGSFVADDTAVEGTAASAYDDLPGPILA